MRADDARDPPRPPDDRRADALTELREIKSEIRKLREMLDSFAGLMLNGFLPHGRPTDKWGRQ